MYSVDEIKELLCAFDNSKATKLEIITENGASLTIAQKAGETTVIAPQTAVQIPVPADEKPVSSPFIHEEEKSSAEGEAVASPMVGVFYSAPAPDKEPYVTVGSKVNKGDVLCLIEAMKLMNEVTAEKSGEISEVCVENGQVVEYGQPLFMIK